MKLTASAGRQAALTLAAATSLANCNVRARSSEFIAWKTARSSKLILLNSHSSMGRPAGLALTMCNMIPAPLTFTSGVYRIAS